MSNFDRKRTQHAAGKWWGYEGREDVGVWKIHDWEMLFEEEIDEAEAHYAEVANDPAIVGTVVAFDDVGSLGKEMQTHITEAWSHLAQQVDVDRTAYVADKIKAMAVKSNVDAPETELQSFEDLEATVDWAQEIQRTGFSQVSTSG